MIDGKYTIEIKNLLIPQRGKVKLRTEDDKVICDINAPVIGIQHTEGEMEGENAFNAEGTFMLFPFGRIRYDLHCEVDGDSLTVTIKSSKGNFNFKGKRVG